MAKLTHSEKELARSFKEDLQYMGGEIFYDTQSLMAVVIIPNDDMKTGGFVRVYVAYCSPVDKFSKKRARLVLADRVYNGNYILFPRANLNNFKIATWFLTIR